MTLRVLQVLGRSAGGIARHVATITEALDGRDGLEVDIAGPPDLPLAMPKGVLPVTIPAGPFGHRRAVRELRAIEGRRYDLVHAHGLRAGVDSTFVAEPVIVTVHNLVHPAISGRLKALAYRRAEGLVVRRSEKVLAVSRDIGRVLRTRARQHGDKVEVVHLGVGVPPQVGREGASLRRDAGVPEGGKVIVTMSRLAPQKALHVMLDAVTRLDAHLWILGEGPLEQRLRDQSLSLGISDRVRFLGFRPDAHDHVAAADVFCLSSVWEGVPLAAQEAIQLGIPVVATDVGGTGELIEDRVSGRLVPPGDPSALAAALREVLEDPHSSSGYADAARSNLERDFSTERMVVRLREIYGEMSS